MEIPRPTGMVKKANLICIKMINTMAQLNGKIKR